MIQAWWLGDCGATPSPMSSSAASIPPAGSPTLCMPRKPRSRAGSIRHHQGLHLHVCQRRTALSFGYGLSYTQFAYSNFHVGSQKVPQMATSPRRSTSKTPASCPATKSSSSTPRRKIPRRPACKVLHAFERLTLQPGEKKNRHLNVQRETCLVRCHQTRLLRRARQISGMARRLSSDIRAQTTIQVTQ